MTHKLTIDLNLLNPAVEVPGMQILKQWKEEGKIDFVEAGKPAKPKDAPYTWPGATPPAAPPPRFRQGKMKDSGTANFGSVAAVLFPSKDPHKLSMTEINQVASIIAHHSSKNEIFVTGNLKDFIDNGRRERLKSAFGILVMNPEEAVRMLAEIQGWELTEKKATKSVSKSR